MAAKPGLKKKYIKLGKGDFAKAWRLQKAAARKGKKKPAKKKPVRKKAARKSPVKRKSVRKKVVRKKVVRKKAVRRKSTQKRKAGNMAGKRRKATTTRRRRSGGGRVNVQKMLMMGSAAAAGAVGAGAVANMIPLPDPRIKAALPIAAGIALGMSQMGKQEMFKFVSVGMVSAGALALVRQFAPNLPLLAGEDETLLDYVPNDSEDVALLGMDDELDSDYMGAAVDLDGESVEVGYNDEEEDLDVLDGEFVTTADI